MKGRIRIVAVWDTLIYRFQRHTLIRQLFLSIISPLANWISKVFAQPQKIIFLNGKAITSDKDNILMLLSSNYNGLRAKNNSSKKFLDELTDRVGPTAKRLNQIMELFRRIVAQNRQIQAFIKMLV